MDDAHAETLALLHHAVPFALVLFRLAGLFLFAPLLSSILLPMKWKALLTLCLSAAMYPLLPVRFIDPAGLDLVSLASLVVTEALIGFSVGLLASIPLMALEMSGVLMGQQMGFGLARVYNPEADFDADILGQLLYYIASGAFLAFGGLEALFRVTADSFARVPIGGFRTSMIPLDILVGVLQSSFELAMRVATPVTGMVLLLVVLLGAVAKTMPQINIMSVGFSIKIICGVGVLAAAAYAVQHAAGGEVDAVITRITDWIGSLAPAARAHAGGAGGGR